MRERDKREKERGKENGSQERERGETHTHLRALFLVTRLLLLPLVDGRFLARKLTLSLQEKEQPWTEEKQATRTQRSLLHTSWSVSSQLSFLSKTAHAKDKAISREKK